MIYAQPTQPQFNNSCTAEGFAVLNPQDMPASNNLYTVSATGVYTLIGSTNVPALNAIGMDGRAGKRYIWGMNSGTPAGTRIPANLYRIGSDGQGIGWSTITPPPGGFGSGVLSFAGDMNPLTGVYYVPAVVVNTVVPLTYTFYLGTFNVDAATYGGVITPTYSPINLGNCASYASTFMTAYLAYFLAGATGPEPSGLFQDLALNPAGNTIYSFMGVENVLMSMDVATGIATCTSGPASNTSLGYTGCTGTTTCEIGGMYFDAAGTLYAMQVDRGNTYTVNTTTGELTLLSSGAFASDSRGDAARCATITMVVTPVKLTSFSASTQGCNLLVKWTTAQEINSDRFEIESSTDGINYEKIGQLKSQDANSSSAKNYAKLVSVPSGTNFIRLKQIDIDEKFEYSQVITATINCTSAWNKNIQVYPTLLETGVIHIQFYSDKAHQLNLSLFTAEGKLIQQQQQKTTAGNNKLEIKSSFLSPGIYLLKVVGEDGASTTTRIIKQ